VELDELQVLKGQAGTGNHSVTVTGTCVRTSATEVGTSITARCENRIVRTEAVEGAVLHVHSDDTDRLAILHDEIKSKVLDEEVGIVAQGLAIEGVEDSVASTVGGGGAAVGLSTLAVLE
jgi:hypothetical protein